MQGVPSAALLGWLAAAITGLAGVLWFRRIAAVRVPENRAGFTTAFAAGLVLGAAALASGAGWLGGVPAGFALVGSATFLGLRLQSRQQARAPAVSVGGRILDFRAPDADGRSFDLASLRGRPYLLKFFRGHW